MNRHSEHDVVRVWPERAGGYPMYCRQCAVHFGKEDDE